MNVKNGSKAKKLRPFIFSGKDYSDVFSLSLSSDFLIKSCMEVNHEMTAAYKAFLEECNRYAGYEAFQEFIAQQRGTEDWYTSVTNTYNNECDLDTTLLYCIASLKEEFYYDKSPIIYIEKHLGGDVRGNYSEGIIYRLTKEDIAETGLMEPLLGFEVYQSVNGALTGRDDIDVYRHGYSQHPIYSLSQEVTELKWHPRKEYFTGRLDGKSLIFMPHHPFVY